MKYSGADWLRTELSPLGRKVADILGAVFLGIYHLEQRELYKVDWTDPRCIEIGIYMELATFDASKLTGLVVACHDACVRMSIVPTCRPRHITLMFHQRKNRAGSMFERHPTIESAIAEFRKRVHDFRED